MRSAGVPRNMPPTVPVVMPTIGDLDHTTALPLATSGTAAVHAINQPRNIARALVSGRKTIVPDIPIASGSQSRIQRIN